jgi:hypothetical protein
MITQRLTTASHDLTHGWHGFLLVYALIAVFSLAGLKRGRAGAEHKFLGRIGRPLGEAIDPLMGFL